MNAYRPLRVVVFIAVVAAGSFLTGCASTGSSLAAKPSLASKFDQDYMAAVEAGARGKAVRVVWVNPPHERGKRYGY
jgi:hypothetical protein